MTEVQFFVFKECVLVVFVFIQRHLAIAEVEQRHQGQIAMGLEIWFYTFNHDTKWSYTYWAKLWQWPHQHQVINAICNGDKYTRVLLIDILRERHL